MSDYLSNIAARSLNQVKVILPRVASRFEPVATTGFAIDAPFQVQRGSMPEKAFLRENDDFSERVSETEASQSSRSNLHQDHHPTPSVFRPSALRRAIGSNISHMDEKSPLADAALEPERNRKSPMNHFEPVPIRSRILQYDGNPARGDHKALIMARSREVSSLQAYLVGSSRKGDFQLKKPDPERNDRSDLHRPSIIAASSVTGPNSAYSNKDSAAMLPSLKSPKSGPSKELYFHAASDSSGDVMHQTQQPESEMTVVGETHGKGSITGAKIAIDQSQSPEDEPPAEMTVVGGTHGKWSIPGAKIAIDQSQSLEDEPPAEVKRPSPTKDKSSGNAGNSAGAPLFIVKSVRSKTIDDNPIDGELLGQTEIISAKPSMKLDQMRPLSSIKKMVQIDDIEPFLPPSPEKRGSNIGSKVVPSLRTADAIEQGSMNPDLRVERPEIQVTIGRIEIRATPQPATTQQRRPLPNLMSLNEYLRQRAGGDGK
jgi:hypothetical protein